MRIDTNLDRDDISAAMQWIGAKLGAALDKRVKGFEEQQSKTPLLGSYYRDIYSIEFGLANARRHHRATGRYPLKREFDRSYAFASALQKFSTLMPSHAVTRLDGALRGALKDSFGLRPLAYEFDTAVHLVRRGFDVEWPDLFGTGRCDLVGILGSDVVEIECKTTSADTGRKVTRVGLHRVADMVGEKARSIAKSGGMNLYTVEIAGRLDTNDLRVAAISSLILRALKSELSVSDATGTVRHTRLNLPTVVLGPEPEIRRQLGNLVPENCHILWYAAPPRGLVAVAVTSLEPDTVAAAITAQAIKAAEQCSGRYPAIVAVQLVELSRAQLQILLDTPNHLHRAARRVFKRAHVNHIAYSVPVGSEMVERGFSRELSAPVLVLNNPTPKFSSALTDSIFSS